MTVAVQPNVAVLRTHPYAGFWVRTLAFLVDGIAIGIVVGVVTVGRPLATDAGGTVIFSTWRNFLETIIGFGYFTLFWSRIGGGQTLGMRLLGLRVVGTDGHPIGYGTAVVRWIGLVISAAVILIGLVWVAFDARKQGWHDKMASTHVMHADALGPLAGPWYDGLLAATASGPVAESAYWLDAPAMGVFLASAVFMIIAAALSLLATIRDGA